MEFQKRKKRYFIDDSECKKMTLVGCNKTVCIASANYLHSCLKYLPSFRTEENAILMKEFVKITIFVKP